MATNGSGTGTILVVGAEGQVARALSERAAASVRAVETRGRPTLDLAAPDTITPALEAVAPVAVVNAAAYTAVDKAESEEALAAAVNAEGVAALARACAARDLPLVHLSTDYVFDGRKDAPYVETDVTAPQGAYGRTKLAGEEAVLAAGGPALVCRTAWVYSPFGHNFVKTMLRVAATRDALRVVDDQHGNPTSALDIADAVLALVARCEADGWPTGGDSLLHVAGTGETTWCGLARRIFAIAGPLGGPTAEVEAIATADYPTPATRPANSRLDTRRLAERHGIRLPRWEESLETVVRRLLAEGWPAAA